MSEGTLESPASPSRPRVAANRFGVDYRRVASALGNPVCPIVDIHAHINGRGAAPIWAEVARLYGVERVFTMVGLPDAAAVRETLGEKVHFIAFPNFRGPDRAAAFTSAFLDDIRVFHREFGARMVKLWNAPRMTDFVGGTPFADLVEFDSPWRVKAIELAQELGMMMMVHVADPDTWFRTKYADSAKYRTKVEHYRGLREVLRRYPMPWIAAHMGGWPEDLGFLSMMLGEHPNLYLDTSATKWVVRELSLHPREETVAFLERWRGRILFGSDIVTTDEHLKPKEGAPAHPMADLADSPEGAFDLYASRYAALRTMFETDYVGESPIADPDLVMVEPGKYGDLAAPLLRGVRLDPGLLRVMYAEASRALLARVGVAV